MSLKLLKTSCLDPSYLEQDEICSFPLYQVLEFNASTQMGEVEHVCKYSQTETQIKTMYSVTLLNWATVYFYFISPASASINQDAIFFVNQSICHKVKGENDEICWNFIGLP